ncbi:PhzF family phenazine biosynthesis protein [Paenibacillus sp. N3.4]|nr:PhzF family phenazine biosynthesis protein [Paenibacillus sp. N3.4]
MRGDACANHKSDVLFNLLIEQGQEVGRDGRIRVQVTNKGEIVEVTGNAVFVREFEIALYNHRGLSGEDCQQ